LALLRGAADILRDRVGQDLRCSMTFSPVIGDWVAAAYSSRLPAGGATPLTPSLGRLPSRKRVWTAHLPALPRDFGVAFRRAAVSPSHVRASAPAAGLERRSRATQDAFHRRDPQLFIVAAPAQVRFNGHARLHRTLIAPAGLRLLVTSNSNWTFARMRPLIGVSQRTQPSLHPLVTTPARPALSRPRPPRKRGYRLA